MDKLQIEYVPIETLRPYENNAKIHTQEQVEQICESIRQFGMNDPIAVWRDGEIIEGHGRLMACHKLGLQTVPIIRLDSLTDEERRAYMNIHNQLTMSTGFDLDLLSEELGKIDNIDMERFGFNLDNFVPKQDWFRDRDRNDDGHQDGNDEYNEFVDKFKIKKTTDDCYTPDNIYDAIADWVANEYRVDRSTFVRPFYPGGDYESEEYPEGCVVVDNPPFSILAQILRFYVDKGILFFLFCPTLTAFSTDIDTVCTLCADCEITYENGAIVNTSFKTNLEPETAARTCPDLTATVAEIDRMNTASGQNLMKYQYPNYVITAAMVSNWSGAGIEYKVRRAAARKISALDAQKDKGLGIFGGGTC